MSKRIFTIIAFVLAVLACSWSDIVPPAAPVIEPSPLPTFRISTLTAVPTETSLPTSTSTPEVPVAWPKDLGVNCRYGPGEEWEAVSSLPAETITEIMGRTIDTSWWYVSDSMNFDSACWVAFDVVDTAGNMNIIPIVEIPVASVSSVTADALVTFSACGSINQVSLNGTITGNGPIKVTYHWEISGDAQMTSPDETFQFSEAGTQKLTSDFFSADCGKYSVRLIVTAPDEIFAKKAFKVQAP